MASIVVWGAGGHAKVIASSIRRSGAWQLAGFIDDVDPARAGEAFCGSRVVGDRSALPALRAAGLRDVVLAFGDNAARLALAQWLGDEGWAFPAIVDPSAVVADGAEIGAGSYVAAGAVVQPGARIGAQVIVNSGAIVEHDVRIGDGAHLGPGACIAGHAEIGRGCWLGAGAMVRDRVRIGEGAIVGMGSIVVADIPAGVTAYGHPARVVAKGGE